MPIDQASLQLIIADYTIHEIPRRRAQEGWWSAKDKPNATIEDAIDRIWDYGPPSPAHPNIRLDPHQRRVGRDALGHGKLTLKAHAEVLNRLNTFHDIFLKVEKLFKLIDGLGELCIYDAAERLRYFKGVESVDRIYMHAGTRDGAKILLGNECAKKCKWIERADMQYFDSTFPTHDIKHLLCVYKNELSMSSELCKNSLARRNNIYRAGCD